VLKVPFNTNQPANLWISRSLSTRCSTVNNRWSVSWLYA